jgi:hypothetical protein
MSDRIDTVSSGPDSPYVEEPDSPTQGQVQQAVAKDERGLIEHDAPAAPTATELLQSTSKMVQGMMASMGQPGGMANTTSEPTVQETSTSMLQSAIVNPDGSVTTGIAGDPSGDARTATSFDPTTNTITTTTVDPATGSITTTSTTVPFTATDQGSSEDRT